MLYVVNCECVWGGRGGEGKGRGLVGREITSARSASDIL